MHKHSRLIALALVSKLGSRLLALESRGELPRRLKKERLRLRAMRAVLIDKAANR